MQCRFIGMINYDWILWPYYVFNHGSVGGKLLTCASVSIKEAFCMNNTQFTYVCMYWKHTQAFRQTPSVIKSSREKELWLGWLTIGHGLRVIGH